MPKGYPKKKNPRRYVAPLSADVLYQQPSPEIQAPAAVPSPPADIIGRLDYLIVRLEALATTLDRISKRF